MLLNECNPISKGMIPICQCKGWHGVCLLYDLNNRRARKLGNLKSISSILLPYLIVLFRRAGSLLQSSFIFRKATNYDLSLALTADRRKARTCNRTLLLLTSRLALDAHGPLKAPPMYDHSMPNVTDHFYGSHWR